MEVCVRSRTVARVLILTAFMFALAVPAAAQQSRNIKPGKDADDLPLFGVGLSFLHATGSTATGIAADVRLPDFNRSDSFGWGIVGDVGFNHFSGATILSVGGGVRITFKPINDKLRPFAQVLIGIEHCCGSTDLYFAPGGGVDFAINRKLNVRAQIDFRHVNATVGFNETRFWFGVSLPLGGS
jgi:hypothetical protein